MLRFSLKESLEVTRGMTMEWLMSNLARQFIIALLAISSSLLCDSYVKAQDRLLDYLPAEDALYIWTDDSQLLFRKLLEQQSISPDALAAAWRIPADWTDGREAFAKQDAEATLRLALELKELWDTPLFEGEAVLINRGLYYGNAVSLILEAPADRDVYVKLVDTLRSISEPMTAEGRELQKEAIKKIPVQPSKTDDDAELPETDITIGVLTPLPGFWAHDGKRFFWSSHREQLIRSLAWFDPEVVDTRPRLTEDRTFETVFRSLSTESRRNALAQFYVPPEAREYLYRRGHNRRVEGLSGLYTPMWLDLVQDLRALGGCVFLPTEEDEKRHGIGWQWEGFALVTQPRGPVLASIEELDLESWNPPSVPRNLRMLFAFGYDGEKFVESSTAMKERYERVPVELRETENYITSIGPDNKILQQTVKDASPGPKDLAPFEDFLRSADEIAVFACETDSKNIWGPRGYYDPFVFVHSASDANALTESLSKYLSGGKPVLSGVDFQPIRYQIDAEWQDSAERSIGLQTWSRDDEFVREKEKTYFEQIDRSLTVQRNTFEKRKSEGDQAAAEQLSRMPITEQMYDYQKHAFSRALNGVWFRLGEWAAIHDVDPDVVEYFRDPSSAKVDSRKQQAQVVEDVRMLQSLAPESEELHGILSLSAVQIGISNRLLNPSDPTHGYQRYFGQWTKPSEADDLRMEIAINSRRRLELQAMFLTSFDRLVITFHDSDKGVSFHGATLGKREYEAIELPESDMPESDMKDE